MTRRDAQSPLTMAQQRLWFLWRLRPDSDEYNVPMALRLCGRFDRHALEWAVNRLAERHAVLRSAFPMIDGSPVARIAPVGTVPFTECDLSGLPLTDRERALRDEMIKATLTPFNLIEGPVFRVHLVRLAAEDHALALTFHHIVTDGWSMGLIDEELAALYGAGLAGTEDPLPAPEYEYQQWAVAEADRLAGPRRHEALAYWRRQLADAPPVSSFQGTHASHTREISRPFPFPKALVEQIETIGARYRVSRFVTLCSAYAALLARLSATDDVVFGVPVSGRISLEVERVVGLFVNMLPLRVRLAADTTFSQLLHQIRDTVLEGHEYQDLPFQTLVEDLRPERSASLHPFFQTVFTFEEPPTQRPSLTGLDTSELSFPSPTAKFDLTVRVSWNRARPELWVSHRAEDDRTAALLGDGYLRLLTAALAAPDTPVSRLPLLSAQQQILLADWSGETTTVSQPAVERVDTLVARHARSRPDAVAVRTADRSVSYGELDSMADLVAAGLRAAGAGPGALVATLLPRGADLVTAVLGIVKSGAAYLPLDPAQPVSRLETILAEARPLLVLADRADSGLPVACLVRTLADICQADTAPTSVEQDPSGKSADLVYVIYTSGSTGRPKGVMVEHAGLAGLVSWHHQEFGIGPGDHTTMVAAPGFDASAWEIWSGLTAGATLEVPATETMLSSHALVSWLVERRITSAFLPTPVLERVLDVEWPAGTALRSVLTGGDRLHAVDTKPLPFRLVNNYGPTENTVVATSGDVHAAGTLPDIGRRIRGVETYVLDGELQPVPVGVVGELYVGGAGLARGYLGQPALTADRFVPHPFSSHSGARIYRTGDMVRWRPDGTLDYVGRNDDQLKIRGVRIEPGEIESILRSHPAIRDAAVAQDEFSLAAYLVLSGDAPDPAELRGFVSQSLPEYMRPHRYLVLPELPLSANGKVDRAALPVGAVTLARSGRASFSTPMEQLLALVWSDALGHDSFGHEDNFFDVGGHSLLLATVGDRLGRELGRPVAIAGLYEHPNIADLARHLTDPGADGVGDSPVMAERHRRGEARLGARRHRPERRGRTHDTRLAVIGMACRFPGAATPETFWRNLVNGVDSVRVFSASELVEWGVDPAIRSEPNYVPDHGIVDGIGEFDAEFFGITARDAVLLNPQHRMFLELAWEALERAGYDPYDAPGPVGLFAGAGRNGYAQLLQSLPERFPGVDDLALSLANEPEHMVTRVSYALGLTGPSVAVQTACSTSLVAVHEAGRALLAGECDLALAGGVTLRVPRTGYRFREGGTMSPDGRCRTFSADARGIVAGDGAGIVVLRRFQDAIDEGDHIHAVILGSAVNNDGRHRAGYTAPGVRGQAEVIRAAHAAADTPAGTLSYVEAHGTGTLVGDPIEVTALTQAFADGDSSPGTVALGSVKTNIGHTDTAAGVAGLIKTALALEHHTLPPTLHYTTPNPRIDFASSPFAVNTETRKWQTDRLPRRAGVSSFGIGGTNAHAVLEEAPGRGPSSPAAAANLLLLSARTPEALDTMAAELADHLRHHPDVPIDDVAYTLQCGRHAFPFRRHVVCVDREDALHVLSSPRYDIHPAGESWVAFQFPELTPAQATNVLNAFAAFPAFQTALDECRRASVTNATDVFLAQYALARLLMDWGLEPVSVTGEGVGELVADCVSGSLSLPDALSRTTKAAVPITESEKTAPHSSHSVLRLGFAGVEDGVLSCLPADGSEELACLLDAVGRLWTAGVSIDWQRLHTGVSRRRVPLPTYPFQRCEYLAQPEPFADPPAAETEKPAGPVEVEPALRKLFQQVLGVTEDTDADFFESGGDSLAAVQLVSLVEEEFEVALTLEDVFDEPTVSGLARIIEGYRANADGIGGSES